MLNSIVGQRCSRHAGFAKPGLIPRPGFFHRLTFAAGDHLLGHYRASLSTGMRSRRTHLRFALVGPESHLEEAVPIVWSVADKPDTRVRAGTMKVIQEIAELAGVELQLSSGLRLGDKRSHGAGRAVDVNAINGIDIGTGLTTNPAAAPLVERVQAAARTHPEVRENFGPAGLWKSPHRGHPQLDFSDGSPGRQRLQRTHMDHIHISVQS
jgi:hypothetical protein